ncbi:MAG: flagellin [SAR324 cluster bacterium]|nr:flagellin [SAR324 cluster bacterium]MBL7034165.1 flagellin [SAR324 cluster bacterium]
MKHNIASLNAINHLEVAQNELSTSLSRLSSGQRINGGADDPSGLVISEGLRAQIASVEQALQNSEFSLSLVQTAEGALVEVNNLLIEMRQLATTAANEGATDFSALLALQFQIRNAIEGIDRVSQFTRFGNKNLLDGSQGATGTAGNEELVFLKASSKTIASPISGYDVDINELPLRASLTEDLDDDDAAGLQITLEEEDGATIRVRNPEGATAAGFANRLQKSALAANMNLDIRYDIDDEELTIEHREYGLAKGFTVVSTKDGVIVDDAYEPELFLGQDIEGTIGDEPADGDGAILTGDFNNKKTSGLSIAFLGDSTGGAGSVTVAQNALKFQSGPSADENILIALNSTHSTVLGRGVDNTSGFENLSQIRLTSTQEAIDAIRLVDEALDQLLSMRGQLGSLQKHTLETNISVLRNTAENLTAAESSIRDTDMALEMANFTKNQIITETAAAAVAQSNQTATRVLQLLFNNKANGHWSFYRDN